MTLRRKAMRKRRRKVMRTLSIITRRAKLRACQMMRLIMRRMPKREKIKNTSRA
jgi:hypothetical protein